MRVNDRGPHSKDRLIDLSYAAAKDFGIVGTGTGEVLVKVILEGKNADNQLFNEKLFIVKKSEKALIFPTFPKFVEKDRKYMKVIKNADGSVKMEFSDK